MPPTVYNYTISTAFPNQKVDIPSLTSEIETALPLPAPQIDLAAGGIGVNVTALDNCDIWFDAALDVAQEATLDGVVAAHSGFGTVATLIATEGIAGYPPTAVVGAGWVTMSMTVTTPRFFAPVAEILGRVLGQVMTDGLGAQWKITQETSLGVKTDMSPIEALPDTAGVFETVRIDSDVTPDDGSWNIYRLEINKNAVANVELQGMTFSMIHFKIV